MRMKDPKLVNDKIAMEGYSIRGFAKKIKASPSYTLRVLNEDTLPSPVFAKRIADGLNESMKSLFFTDNGHKSETETVDV